MIKAISEGMEPVIDEITSLIERESGWIYKCEDLRDNMDYVFHLRGQSLYVFGRYQEKSNTINYRFGTANGIEDSSMMIKAIAIPNPPKSEEV